MSFPLIHDDALTFSEGFAAVKNNGKWGYLDSTGKIFVEPKYMEAMSFHYGFAVVSNGNDYGFIDTSEKLAIPMIYEGASNFSEGLAYEQKRCLGLY